MVNIDNIHIEKACSFFPYMNILGNQITGESSL